MIENSSGGTPSPAELANWASNYGLTFPVVADGDMGETGGYIWADGASSFYQPTTHLIGPAWTYSPSTVFISSF